LAVNYRELSENLCRFYDFTDKVVLYVGAGGRQLLEPSTRTRKLIAIDENAQSLMELEKTVVSKGIQHSVEIVASRFEDVQSYGDVVYFEFSLHEISDPEKALSHAAALAGDIVVFDHLPASEWVFHAAEEDKVSRSTEAVERAGIRRRETFHTVQRFHDHAELLAKISGHGRVATEKSPTFRRRCEYHHSDGLPISASRVTHSGLSTGRAARCWRFLPRPAQ
jgi:hypothetical protein